MKPPGSCVGTAPVELPHRRATIARSVGAGRCQREVPINLRPLLCALALTAALAGPATAAPATPPAKPKKTILQAVVSPIIFFPQMLLVRPALAVYNAAHNLVFGPPRPQPAVRNKGVLVDKPPR